MHDCRKFREHWIDRAIGPTREDRPVDFELCPECERFLGQVFATNDALKSGGLDLAPEESWNRFEKRFRERLADEPLPLQARSRWPATRWLDGIRSLRFSPWLSEPRRLAVGAMAVAILAAGAWRLAVRPPQPGPAQIVNAAPLPLDSQTVEFLGRSEMFLRSFAKIQVSDAADLEDARDRARMQLASIADRKAAVVAVPPVWDALEEYETVLREIKNLDGSSEADVEDIQSRITRRGLIAAMKVYQPAATRSGYRQDREN